MHILMHLQQATFENIMAIREMAKNQWFLHCQEYVKLDSIVLSLKELFHSYLTKTFFCGKMFKPHEGILLI